MEYFRATLIILLSWGLGAVIGILLYKIGMKDHQRRENKTRLNNTYEDEVSSIATTIKHYKLTAIISCVGLVIALILTFKPLQWLCAIACGMSLPPVFYDVFYNCLPKVRQSKLHLCLAVGSSINLILMGITLNFYYWAYIYYKFI